MTIPSTEEYLLGADEAKKRRSRFTLLIGLTTILASLTVLVYFAYYTLAPLTPIELFDEDGQPLEYDAEKKTFYGMKVVDEDGVLHRGEDAFYEINFCRYTTVGVDVEKHIVNGVFLELNEENTSSGGSFEKGCVEGLKLPFHVPELLPDGEYRLRARIDYKYAPIRTETRFFFTEPFIIQ